MVSETLIDWIKHSFVTLFNRLPSHVYDDYLSTLAKDLVANQGHVIVDRAPVVAGRIGFSAFPLAFIVVHVVSHVMLTSLSWSTVPVIALALVALAVVKLATAVGVFALASLQYLKVTRRAGDDKQD